MKPLPTIIAAIAIAVSFTPGLASADQVSIVPDQDATIFSEDLNGAIGQGHLFVGNNMADFSRRALVRFNLDQIPAGSLITSATLRLQCTRVRPGTQTLDVHRMTTAWTEGPATGMGTGGGIPTGMNPGDVTWQYSSFAIPDPDTFVTLGGDYDAAPSVSMGVGGVGQYDFSSAGLVTDVSGWVNAPSTNYGWILIGNESTPGTAKRYDSREDTSGPVVIIEFTPPTPVETTSWGRIKALFEGE